MSVTPRSRPGAAWIRPEVDLVLASYAAFARGDIDAAVAPLTDQTEWVEPDDFPGGGRRVGRAAVAEISDHLPEPPGAS
jgi:ketosteroid isomerase-like protein